MQVSFIIPLYNCLPFTQAMLASLRQTLPPDLAGEIILVDDGSTDGTRAWLQNLPSPCRTILNEANLGFARACNCGAAAATGDFLFFLNNDLVLLPHWLEPMLEAFAHFPATGLVGNVQLNAATGAVDHAGIFFNHKCKPEHATELPPTTALLGFPAYRTVDALTGACFALRRATWEKLGGFDEGFVNGGEDIDLCLRARAAGLHQCIALQSVVRHHISQSAGRKLHDEQNTFRLVERWSGEIVLLAAPAWSREQISTLSQPSEDFDYPRIWAALAHLLLRQSPPRRVREGVAAAMQLERRRWHELLEGAPPHRPQFPAGPI
jgi:GT2 family glycosyltransferase